MKEHFQRNKKTYMYILIAIIVIIIIVQLKKYADRKRREREIQSSTGAGAEEAKVINAIVTSLDKNKVIGLGATGTEVKVLQNMLNKYFGFALTEDGQAGNQTINALQSSTGLSSVSLGAIHNAVSAVNAGVNPDYNGYLNGAIQAMINNKIDNPLLDELTAFSNMPFHLY